MAGFLERGDDKSVGRMLSAASLQGGFQPAAPVWRVKTRNDWRVKTRPTEIRQFRLEWF
jgi:hypothetical protein